MSNTQLPDEWKDDILKLADVKTIHLKSNTDFERGFCQGMERGIEIGATEYAIKLHQAEQENKELKDQIEQYVLDGRDRDFKGRALLKKVASRHEAGLLPDSLLYNEIKTFLDGK